MAEKNKYRFKGHESFVLREGWLNKGLMEVEKNPRIFLENYGADALGVGPNMAKAIRYWLRCSGLTVEATKSGVQLTPLGKLILQYDSYIEDVFTLWLIHCNIATNKTLATAWNLFFNDFSYEEFEKNQLVEEMKRMAENLPGDSKAAESSVGADCDAILHMYTAKQEKESNPEEKNVSPFGKLGLLKKSNQIYQRKQPNLSKVPDEILWYLIVKCLDGRNSVYLEDLLNMTDGPGKLLQLKRTGLMELLEHLEQKGIITLNRTAGLNMVYLNENVTELEVVDSYYHT